MQVIELRSLTGQMFGLAVRHPNGTLRDELGFIVGRLADESDHTEDGNFRCHTRAASANEEKRFAWWNSDHTKDPTGYKPRHKAEPKDRRKTIKRQPQRHHSARR